MEDAGLRSLAAAVLRQAVMEAHGGPRASVTPAHREPLRSEALAFLTPADPDLQFWCACLEWDPETFCEAARRNGAVLLTQKTRDAILEADRAEEAPWGAGT